MWVWPVHSSLLFNLRASHHSACASLPPPLILFSFGFCCALYMVSRGLSGNRCRQQHAFWPCPLLSSFRPD